MPAASSPAMDGASPSPQATTHGQSCLEQECRPESRPQSLPFTISPLQNLLNGQLHVVVAYPMRNSLQILKRIYMTFKESFSTLGGQGTNKEFARIVQSHACQMHFSLLDAHHHLS